MKNLINNHYKYTNSQVAKLILNNWDNELKSFVKVMPIEYKRAISELYASSTKEVA